MRRESEWQRGMLDTPVGPVPQVATNWTGRDRIEHVRCRLGAFRDRYAIPAGLYAVGTPGPNAPVFVTANYKLSFDHLRRALGDLDAWILVLDTAGVNVWCAAGKGTFGTDELVRRIRESRLDAVVSHRHLIVPQLGAPGVSAHEVQRATRFRVHFGPVRAADVQAYVRADLQATPDMRRVRFGFLDRLVLVPMELAPASKAFAGMAAAVMLLFVVGRHGLVRGGTGTGLAATCLVGLALLAGAVVTPLLLPVIPGRSFALKGALTGVALAVPYAAFVRAIAASPWLVAFALVFVPAASSYLALQFTGSTTFTSLSGVRKELRHATPLHILGLVAAMALLIVARASDGIAR